jgi:proteic killer suppression protein
MILNFKDKETEEFWLTGKSRKLPATLKKRAYARLQALHAAGDIKDRSSRQSVGKAEG